mmetsp:Transcript_7042/g.13433  ORF Transcript_7042/g.13433 Transcript_7042/m.13433 type:complete len:523 (-) Transcript_7042:213-1781(-)
MGASQSAKIPKDLKNAKVQVALEKTCYQSGDRVGGYVDIIITEGSVKCTKIDVEMKAESLTTVHYTTTSGSGKNRRTHHHTARETANNYRFRMTGSEFPSGKADIGHYQIPFEFTIPPTAPSTVVVPLIGRNSASITHMVAVGIDVGGGKVHYVHSVPFQVISKVNHPINETMIEDRKEVDCCCCFGKGEMVLGAHLNKNAYQAGEQASVTYEINNASTSKVDTIKVNLVATVRATARGHSFLRSTVLASMFCDGVEPNEGFGSHRQEGGPAKQFLLRVPPVCPYPSVSVPTVNIEYKIVMTAETAYCVTNPSIELLVTLYQQQLQQDVMVQGHNLEEANPADDQNYIPMYASVSYAPDSSALYGTAPPAYMRTPVAVPVDTTGDGIANAMGYDTTGDGKIDSLDTNGDGRIDMMMPSQQPPIAQAVVQIPSTIPVDTTGDGRPNAMGYDTNGDGRINALDTTGDGKIDMQKPSNYVPNSDLPPAYSVHDSNSQVHPDPNGYGSSYATSYSSAPPYSQSMQR